MNSHEPNPAQPLIEPLTRREREILVYLNEGFSAPEIAEQLTLAISTVKSHIQQVYGKLGVNSKRQALTRAKELGLLDAAGASAELRPAGAATTFALPQAASGPPVRSEPSLPTGTITFLFTDIEGSTRLWQAHRDAMPAALARHHAVLKAAMAAHNGHVFQIVGDAFCVAFATPVEGVAAALAAQRALRDEPWGQTGPVRVRMALHSGSAPMQAGDHLAGVYGSGLTLSHAARLLSAGHGGQILLSQAACELFVDQMPGGLVLRDLGEHQLKDLVRREHIYQVVAPDLAAEFPPLATLEASPNNLPVQLTSFIGREKEIAEVKRLLGPLGGAPAASFSSHSEAHLEKGAGDAAGVRLLTLIGPGGTGKTRLALQAASALLPVFPDGVWFVELAPLADSALVSHAVATALGVRDQVGRPILATLIDCLRHKIMLLLLDNCEHLITACAQFAAALLQTCPHLCLLATSREMLGVAGERPLRVPSLSTPKPQVALSDETAIGYDSVRLFVERAVVGAPEFALTSKNVPAVAQVCRRLDGIPLAIELAAVRLRVLPVEQIAARLDDRFRLLTGGNRTELPRHQTLRALIDWSHELLTAAEQALLRRLSVFAGGWTLEAAESVCAGDGLESYEVLDLLAQLASKSLIAVEEQAGAARYSMLETIRQYARDKLAESGEADRTQDAHLDYFLRSAEAVEATLWGADQLLWLKRLEAELDNFRGALQWADRAASAEASLRLAGALVEFWRKKNHLSEGRGWLERGFARPDRADLPKPWAKALWAAGYLGFYQGDLAAARAWLLESMAISREHVDKVGLADSLRVWGIIVLFQGDADAAYAAEVESVATYRAIQNPWGLAMSLYIQGLAKHSQGDNTAAQTAYAEVVTLLGESGDRWELSSALTGMGRLALQQGDYALARARFERVLALRREINDKFLIAHSLNYLGIVARRESDHRRAAALYRESVSLFQEVGNRHGLALCLASFGGMIADQGQPARAARLLGAAAGALERLSAAMVLGDPVGYEYDVAAVRNALGDEAFAAAWAEGQAMTLDQAIIYASEG
jgi:predicted ATPase/class 3 adenylate cyclase